MTLHEQFLKLLDIAIARFGSANKLAKYLNVSPNLITRWKNRERVPQLDTIQPFIDMMKAELIPLENGKAREVRFVKAHIRSLDSEEKCPQEDNFIAIPILGEVDAGPGYTPEEEVEDWFMVSKDAVRGRDIKQLLAVRIAPHSISMQPTLKPHDIVLVDKNDKDIATGGNIMLVRDPMDGSGMVKRVNAREVKGDVQITFYSDNANQYPPMVYSLMEDFDGEWDRAIAGKVIWAWTDMRGK